MFRARNISGKDPKISPKSAEKSANDSLDKKDFKAWLWREFKFFTGLGLLMLGFLTLVWGHFKIPSESMQPTLEVGDHIYVSKFAYGYSRHSLPFKLHHLGLAEGKIFSRLPLRGDVAVFRNPKNDLVMVKRIIGLPGDRIKIEAGQLYVNGRKVERTQYDDRLYREHKGGRVVKVKVYAQTLPSSPTDFSIYERSDSYPLDQTELFTVPLDHVFFMGDNRDNSTDSRAPEGPGFVPLDHLIGRADRMMFSFKKCDRDEGLYCPDKARFLEKL